MGIPNRSPRVRKLAVASARLRVWACAGVMMRTGHWREIGTPTDYLEVMLLRLAGTTWIHPSAKISPSASIRNSFIGRSATISDRAVVADSVVVENALVGEGALVTRSVLLGAVEVAANEIVAGEFRAQGR